jgi:outer membrane protein
MQFSCQMPTSSQPGLSACSKLAIESIGLVNERPVMKYCSILALLCLSPVAFADSLFGVYAGVGTWKTEASGHFDTGTGRIDLNQDLGLEEDLVNTFYVAMEHGVPVLPNVEVAYVSMSAEGSGSLSRSFNLDDVTFSANETIASSVELDQQDLVLYYQMLDNWVSIDAGIAVRWLNGEIHAYSDSASGRARMEGAVPLFYGKARFDLPFSGMWLAADAKGMSFDGNELIDAKAVVGWQSKLGLGLEAGWRTYMLTLEEFDEVTGADIRVQGPFASLNYHF